MFSPDEDDNESTTRNFVDTATQEELGPLEEEADRTLRRVRAGHRTPMDVANALKANRAAVPSNPLHGNGTAALVAAEAWLFLVAGDVGGATEAASRLSGAGGGLCGAAIRRVVELAAVARSGSRCTALVSPLPMCTKKVRTRGNVVDVDVDNNDLEVRALLYHAMGYGSQRDECLHQISSSSIVSACFDVLLRRQRDGKEALVNFKDTSHPALGILWGQRFMQERKWEEALEAFERVMLQDEEHGLIYDDDRKIVILNICTCFQKLGAYEHARDMLQYLLEMESEMMMGSPVKPLVPAAIWVSGTGISARMMMSNTERLHLLLWKLLDMSSRLDDWATCTTVVDRLLSSCNDDDDVHAADAALCAQVFVQLQKHRPSVALSLLQEWKRRRKLLEDNDEYDNSYRPCARVRTLLRLYEADAVLTLELGIDVGDDGDKALDSTSHDDDHVLPPSLQNTATAPIRPSLSGQRPQGHYILGYGKTLDILDKDGPMFRDDVGDTDDQGSDDVLAVALANDRGVASLLAGRVMEAFSWFRRAVLLSTASTSRSYMPHFNLCLLLWREGYCDEAARTWAIVRGWRTDDDEDSVLDERLDRLKEESVLRHGQVLASASRVQNHAHVPPWAYHEDEDEGNSEKRTRANIIGGMDARQVSMLDLVVLDYAIFARNQLRASAYHVRHGGLSDGLDRYLSPDYVDGHD